MLTVGLDVHQRMTVACVLDEHGKTLRSVTVRGGWEKAVEFVRAGALRSRCTRPEAAGYPRVLFHPSDTLP